jgi:magnesium chelatase family protein
VAAAARAGIVRVVVPVANAREAALVPGVRVKATDSLHRLVSYVRGAGPLLDPPDGPAEIPPAGPDLADVAGQALGRRAIEIAAAGGHHLALLGPPGAGKTMLAERMPSLLPELNDEAALEVTALHSIAGVLAPGGPLLRRPPFQAPHHTATVPALVGAVPAWPGPARSRWPTEGCCSSTRRRSSTPARWRRCGSPWRPER